MKVLYFANLKETLGIAEETLNSQFATVNDIISYLSTRGEDWKAITNLILACLSYSNTNQVST
jgi:molybdopterin converting factor small subunit